MIPNSVLNKLRSGISLAGITLALQVSGANAEETPTAVTGAQVCPTPLTPEQLAALEKLVVQLGSEDQKEFNAAFTAIQALGKAALEPLNKLYPKFKDNGTHSKRIRTLMTCISGDGCIDCGRG